MIVGLLSLENSYVAVVGQALRELAPRFQELGRRNEVVCKHP